METTTSELLEQGETNGAPSQDPRFEQAFPKLLPRHITAIEGYAKAKRFKNGDVVWRAGTIDLCMYVVLQGEMAILDGRNETHIVTHTEGSFSGDVSILSGWASLVTAVAQTELHVLEVPTENVRTIVGEQPEVGGIILRAFLMRRALLIEGHIAGPLVVGSRYSPDTLRIREFLTRNLYPVIWEDLESSPETATALREFNVPVEETPIVVLPDGQVLLVPSNAELATALGIKRPLELNLYDLVIVGGGPAGLAASVYGASEGLNTLLLDAFAPGGQAGTSSKIENYMGFPLGLSGQELANGAIVQAEKFGAQMVVPANVTAIGCNPRSGHQLEVDGKIVECKCVILAPGATYRKLQIPRLEEFEGRGIYYAATHIERAMCERSRVVVVGGGNSAGQAAVYMAESTEHVFLVVRSGDLHKNMSQYLARRIERAENITVLVNSEIRQVHGEHHIEAVTIVDNEGRETRKEKVSSLFVMIGAIPNTDWLSKDIVRDEKGFILTGPQLLPKGHWDQQRPPYFLETSCPGVFAAGDARAGSIKRVASAVGEGAMAVAFIHQFLAL